MKPTIKESISKSERDTIERKAKELDKVLRTSEFTGDLWMLLRGVLMGLDYCLGHTTTNPLNAVRFNRELWLNQENEWKRNIRLTPVVVDAALPLAGGEETRSNARAGDGNCAAVAAPLNPNG